MRENRPYGLEGGGAQTNVSSLPLSTIAQGEALVVLHKSRVTHRDKRPTIAFMLAGGQGSTLSMTHISAIVCGLGLLVFRSSLVLCHCCVSSGLTDFSWYFGFILCHCCVSSGVTDFSWYFGFILCHCCVSSGVTDFSWYFGFILCHWLCQQWSS